MSEYPNALLGSGSMDFFWRDWAADPLSRGKRPTYRAFALPCAAPWRRVAALTGADTQR